MKNIYSIEEYIILEYFNEIHICPCTNSVIQSLMSKQWIHELNLQKSKLNYKDVTFFNCISVS